MKVSLNTIRQMNQLYGSAEDVTAIGTEKLIKKVGAQLGGIDEIIDLGPKYQGIVIVKVVKCVQHPNADKLSLCRVDDGGVVQNVERGDDGLVQVVCGALNVKAGMLAAWLPPGATVPETVGKDPFVLEARELRGQVSNGMLASPKELSLGDSHAGILDIDGDHTPGTDFAEAFGLKDDVVLDIENKMFTHRPDCFGFLGIARELAGIQQMPFKSPAWYKTDIIFPEVETEELPLEIKNELPELVPRFTAVVISGVKVGPSPTWLVVELAKLGQKSINNIVDYTNWFMLETGQPIHAYDYDKVRGLSGAGGPVLIVRHPETGEKVSLLNGKTIEPRTDSMMVATDQKLIGLGGAMGGSETEVDLSTKNIIIEAASWDMYNMRRTSMVHGIFTEAVTRFTKGQSPLQNRAVVARMTNEVRQHALGKVASEVIDVFDGDKLNANDDGYEAKVEVNKDFINSRLGLTLSTDQIGQLLTNVEVQVEVSGDELTIKAPFWRTDIDMPEDIVEEVGRLYGYDKLPLELPQRKIVPTTRDTMFDLKAKIRSSLNRAGANEVLTYSFVHGNLLDKVGQDKHKAFQVANALSPDLQYYRLSLLPSLLDKVHANVKSGYDEFALFEIGKTHVFGEHDAADPAVPKEINNLSFVYSSKTAVSGAPYYLARKHLINLLSDFKVYEIAKLDLLEGADLYNNPWVEQMVAPFEPKRSAVLRDYDGLIWGVVGEFKPSVREALKLPKTAAGFEIDPLLLLQASEKNKYVPMPRFPKVSQDITLKVPTGLSYQEVYNFVWQELGKVQPQNSLPKLRPVDIYQSDQDPEHKNITLRFTIASYESTLTDQKINKLLDAVAEAASQIQAQRI